MLLSTIKHLQDILVNLYIPSMLFITVMLTIGGFSIVINEWKHPNISRIKKKAHLAYGELVISFFFIFFFYSIVIAHIFSERAANGFTTNVMFMFWPENRYNIFVVSANSLNIFFIILMFMMLLFTTIHFKLNIVEERFFKDSSISTLKHLNQRYTTFNFFSILLCFLLTFFFTTQNIFIFFICFETSVLPIFIIMGFFGKRSQKFKALQYLLYFTLTSGVPFFITCIVTFYWTNSVFYSELKFLVSNLPNFAQFYIFIGCFLPFAVKFSFFPLHGWLPEAHVEASTEGSMLLSGIMLKLGFFGVAQYCINLVGSVLFAVAAPILTFALVGSFTTALSTYRQLDIKKIIAYSSVVHMNMSLFGYFTFSTIAMQGAIFMNLSHAIVSAGLFSLVGLLQDRLKSRNILEIAGLINIMPFWSFLFLIFLLGNAGLPGTVGFISEAAIIWGCFQHFPYVGILFLIPLNVMALRNFALYAQLCWGSAYSYTNEFKFDFSVKSKVSQLVHHWDLNFSGEGFIPAIIAVCSIVLGIAPKLLITILNESATLSVMKILL